MNIVDAVREARTRSGYTEASIGEALGMTAQSVHNKIAAGRKDVRFGTAARMLDVIGYRVVLAPKGRRIPDEFIVIDEWAAHGNSPSADE